MTVARSLFKRDWAWRVALLEEGEMNLARRLCSSVGFTRAHAAKYWGCPGNAWTSKQRELIVQDLNPNLPKAAKTAKHAIIRHTLWGAGIHGPTEEPKYLHVTHVQSPRRTPSSPSHACVTLNTKNTGLCLGFRV